VWTLDRAEQLLREVAPRPGADVVVDASGLRALDLAGTWVLHELVQRLERGGSRVDLRLRPEHTALLGIVSASGLDLSRSHPPAPTLLVSVGARAVAAARAAGSVLAFVGDAVRVAAGAAIRPGRVRWRSVLHNVQTAGFDALPIVGLLSLLMGLVIAYQGATQLRRYGANIFVADLVGFAMLRELSPLLTAIIVAGRSGSAFAAQIGTMKVTEEIDALRTVGISPTALLVLPKILGLALALPLLTVYADAMGVVGGMIMARSELAVAWPDFLDRLGIAIHVGDYLVGLGKAPLFAAIIAIVGCHQGFQVSGDAESVGRRTTVSVVQSVFLVIVLDALLSIAFSALGI
jgi:phospholipid/cholesterol/gamma-HCH transport system permease protein